MSVLDLWEPERKSRELYRLNGGNPCLLHRNLQAHGVGAFSQLRLYRKHPIIVAAPCTDHQQRLSLPPVPCLVPTAHETTDSHCCSALATSNPGVSVMIFLCTAGKLTELGHTGKLLRTVQFLALWTHKTSMSSKAVSTMSVLMKLISTTYDSLSTP